MIPGASLMHKLIIRFLLAVQSSVALKWGLNAFNLVAGIGLILYGWTREGWLGALTSITAFSSLKFLFMACLGFGWNLSPSSTSLGRMEKKFVWLSLAAFIAGLYWGGWRWGWLTSLAVTTSVQIIATKFANFTLLSIKTRRQSEIIYALAAATDSRIMKCELLISNDERRLLDELFDFLENDSQWVRAFSKLAGSRKKFYELYAELVSHGGAKRVRACQVAGASLCNPKALRYLLSKKQSSTEEKVSALTRYFAGYRDEIFVFEDLERIEAEEFESTLKKSSDEAGILSNEHAAFSESDGSVPQSSNFFIRKIYNVLWIQKYKRLVDLETMGRWDELHAEAKMASEYYRKAEARDDPSTLCYLASSLRSQGKYSQALCILENARNLAEKEVKPIVEFKFVSSGWEFFTLGECIHQLAILWLLMNDLDRAKNAAFEALTCFDKARTFNMPESMLFKITLSHVECLDLLGDIVATGNLEEAEPLYKAAYNLRCERFGANSLRTAPSICKLAVFSRNIGNDDIADSLFIDARKILEQSIGTGFDDKDGLARVLYEQAVHFLRRRELAEAEENLVRCLALLNNSSSFLLCSILARLVIIGIRTNRPDFAINNLERAGVLLDGIVRQMMSVMSERQRMTFFLSTSDYTEMFASCVLQHLKDNPRATQLLTNILLRNKALGAEVFAQQRTSILAGRRPDLASKLERLKQLRTRIAEAELTRPGRTHRPNEVLRKWEVESESLEKMLSRQMGNLWSNYPDINVEAVSRILPKGSALIELFCGRHYDLEEDRFRDEQRYCGLVLRSGEPNVVSMVDLGEAAIIDQLIIDYQAFLSRDSKEARHLGETSTSEGADTGPELSKQLFAPFENYLNDVKHIFLCPAGNLVRQSFEVLLDSSGEYLIDRYEFTYLSSGRELLHPWTGDPQRAAPPLVMAHPNYDLAGDGDGSANTTEETAKPKPHSRDLSKSRRFDPLDGTLEEGVEVATALGVKALLNDDALEGSVKDKVSPRILHIATHGVFLEDIPLHDAEGRIEGDAGRSNLARLSTYENPLLRSFLAMAGANTFLDGRVLPPKAEDGILNAVDVSGLDLIDTELVVLSACSTGVGVERFGEGVIGLRRAFAIAGAKSLVMSLWNVPDEETRLLMGRFYEELKAPGSSPSRALLVARRELKKAGVISPYTWGAFICQGDVPIIDAA